MRKNNYSTYMGKKLVLSHKADSTRGAHRSRGVFLPWWIADPGHSIMGVHVEGDNFCITAKQRHVEMLTELRAMPKPNLP